jgi:hypothetical protein
MMLSRLPLVAGCLLFAWGAFLVSSTSGEDSKLEPGFVSLFNGKDLTGWHKNPEKIGHGSGGKWEVEDGAISGEQDPPGSGNGGILLSDKTYGDFEVIFEANPDWGPCSGFFLRSTEKGQCFQMMLDYHDKGNVGEIYREGLDGVSNRTFDLNGEYADADKKVLKEIKASAAKPTKAGEAPVKIPDWSKVWKIGGWNTMKCKVVGNPPTITTWINGTQITEYTSDKAFENVLQPKGHIAFQVHGGSYGWPKGSKVRFRNVRVKELP